MSLGPEFKDLRTKYKKLATDPEWGKEDIFDLAEPACHYLAEKISSKSLDNEQRSIEKQEQTKKADDDKTTKDLSKREAKDKQRQAQIKADFKNRKDDLKETFLKYNYPPFFVEDNFDSLEMTNYFNEYFYA